MAKPEIVFADEPTGNLDTKTTKEVMELIKQMAKDNHQTIVMVTHDQSLAAYADKVIHILEGKIQSIELPRTITNAEPVDVLSPKEITVPAEAPVKKAPENTVPKEITETVRMPEKKVTTNVTKKTVWFKIPAGNDRKGKR